MAASAFISHSMTGLVKSAVHLMVFAARKEKMIECRNPVTMPVQAGSFDPNVISISRYFILTE